MASQFVRSWRPDGDVRAVLAIIPGFNSRSSSYERFAGALGARGIAVYALDRKRFAAFGDDIGTLLSVIREREPSRPIFVLGIGVGGVVAGLRALAHQQHLAGLICASIALDPAAFIPAVSALARLGPRLPVLGPIAAMLRANEQLRAVVSQLTLPLLVLHGSADKLARPSGSEFLHERAGSLDKTLQIFEGYYHDLIDAEGREMVADRIGQWIEARLDATVYRLKIGIEYINPGS